jgi:two-component system, NarL family, nitrate/nitrite response regulator NarL
MAAMEPQRIRIAILHGNQLFRESLGCCLAQVDSFSVGHDASKLEEIEEALCSYHADVLILESGILCRGGEGNAARILCLSSKVKILVIGLPESESDILYCIETGGASGYLPHNSSVKDLVNNIKAIVQGETLCSPRIASLAFCRMSQLARQTEKSEASNGRYLTRREAEIVALIENDLSNKEIAVRLKIEVSTVKNHVHNILDKLQLHNRHSAVNYIKEQGFTAPRF